MVGKKWKYRYTVVEVWIYHLSEAIKRKKNDLLPKKGGENDLRCWFRINKESFAKSFLIIARFSYNEKLKIRKVEKN